MNDIKYLLDDFLSLFYPRVCQACENSLYKGEEVICTNCIYHLPRTDYHQHYDNPLMQYFRGNVKIDAAASCYYFNKGMKIQKMIHRFKYKGQKEIGSKIGELYGFELLKSSLFQAVDIILPVPLHISRLRSRGYNQSDYFAQGLSKSMNIPSLPDCLKRSKKTETQTRKSRFSRWQNVEEVFFVAHPADIAGKHILLVDDVITTGSTLSACAETLIKKTNGKVSIATIACSYQ